MNKEFIAENFVNDELRISAGSMSLAFVNNPAEKALRTNINDLLKKRNVLRLLALTNNFNEQEYAEKVTPLNTEIDKFSQILWTK